MTGSLGETGLAGRMIDLSTVQVGHGLHPEVL
jgi:hypothetical protein